jgi:hypothetical protein
MTREGRDLHAPPRSAIYIQEVNDLDTDQTFNQQTTKEGRVSTKGKCKINKKFNP